MSDQRLPFHADKPKLTRRRRELRDVGFTPSSRHPEQPHGAVTVDGAHLVVTFSHKYRPYIAAIKSIRGVRFDPARTSWLAHVGNIRAVRTLAARHGWRMSDAVKAIPDIDPDDVPLLVSAQGEQLVLIGTFEHDDTWEMLAASDARWDRSTGQWFIPYEAALDVIFDLRRDRRVRFVGDRSELMEAIDAAAEMLRLSRALDNTTGFDPSDKIVRDLTSRPFQIPGIEYAVRARRAFSWGDVGSGKTTVALGALEHLDAFPALVIPPAGLKTNWQREIAAVLPHRSVHICEGRTPAAPWMEPDIWLANYDILWWWREFFTTIDLAAAVADEAHRLGNPKSKRTKAALAISQSLPTDAPRFALTATPVRNRRPELIPQLAFIGREGEFGDRKQIMADDRLSRRLRTVCAWRPDPKEVLTSIGVVNADGTVDPLEDRVTVDGDPTTMVEYRDAERNIWQYLTEQARKKAIELGEDPHSAAVSAAMKLNSAQHLMVINTLVALANRAKIKPAVEWVTDFAASGDKILVFCERVDMMDAITKATGWPQIRGGVPRKRRVEIEDQFQGRLPGELQGIVLQYQAGGEGLTLTEAWHTLHTELRWSPGDHIQADGRSLWRMNDPHNITAHYLVAANTIDEIRMDVLDGKRAEMATVTDGDRMATADGSTFDDVLSILLKRALEQE